VNEEWWERPVCFVCDYWWALLLAIVLALAAYFTRGYWLPLLSPQPVPPLSVSTPVTNSTPMLVSPTPTPQASWSHLDGDGYSIDYPPDWFAYQPPSTVSDPSGIHYDLILSDAPGNEDAQSATSDEKARALIWFLPKPEEPLTMWVTAHWAWLDTELIATTLGNKPVLNAALNTSSVYREFFWYETASRVYVIETYVSTDDQAKRIVLQQILESISLLDQGG